jgi:hypothetical protein
MLWCMVNKTSSSCFMDFGTLISKSTRSFETLGHHPATQRDTLEERTIRFCYSTQLFTSSSQIIFCLRSSNDVPRWRDVTFHLKTSDELHNLTKATVFKRYMLKLRRRFSQTLILSKKYMFVNSVSWTQPFTVWDLTLWQANEYRTNCLTAENVYLQSFRVARFLRIVRSVSYNNTRCSDGIRMASADYTQRPRNVYHKQRGV